MSRPLRIEIPDGIYHVTSRGNGKQPIFLNDGNRMLFLATLGDVVTRHRWRCHAYCLMGNHYHLLLETPEPNLSRGMQQLNGSYTLRFNRVHRHHGHVLQGRFHAVLVERASHLLELCRYIVLNPVRAGMVASVEHYAWSSYRATVGLQSSEPWFHRDWVLAQFGTVHEVALAAYAQFVEEGRGRESPLKDCRSQILAESTDFIAEVKERITRKRQAQEHPLEQRVAGRPALEEIFSSEVVFNKAVRNHEIHTAFGVHRYTMSAIAQQLGLHYTTVSKILKEPR